MLAGRCLCKNIALVISSWCQLEPAQHGERSAQSHQGSCTIYGQATDDQIAQPMVVRKRIEPCGGTKRNIVIDSTAGKLGEAEERQPLACRMLRWCRSAVTPPRRFRCSIRPDGVRTCSRDRGRRFQAPDAHAGSVCWLGPLRWARYTLHVMLKSRRAAANKPLLSCDEPDNFTTAPPTCQQRLPPHKHTMVAVLVEQWGEEALTVGDVGDSQQSPPDIIELLRD